MQVKLCALHTLWSGFRFLGPERCEVFCEVWWVARSCSESHSCFYWSENVGDSQFSPFYSLNGTETKASAALEQMWFFDQKSHTHTTPVDRKTLRQRRINHRLSECTLQMTLLENVYFSNHGDMLSLVNCNNDVLRVHYALNLLFAMAMAAGAHGYCSTNLMD